MPITIDLGGAPSDEGCAQLGHTEDFAKLNQLEVHASLAAIVAVYGAPPAGCELRTLFNHHDFGTYRTLGLVIDDSAPVHAARRYADEVEDGLCTWVEAAMRAPVEYREDGTRPAPSTLTQVLVSTIMTTRPTPDGRFPLPAFATILDNIATSCPEAAERFAELQGEPA